MIKLLIIALIPLSNTLMADDLPTSSVQAPADSTKKNSPSPKDQLSDWETRLEYARVLSYMKKYDESIAEYQKVLQEKPDLIEPKIEIAKIYYYQGKGKEALSIIDSLPNKDLTPDLQIIQADIYLSEKNYDQAEEIYLRNLNQNPEKKDAILLKLAEIYSWEKRYPESLAIYEELLSRHPQDVQLQRKYAMVLMWAGKQQEAAQILKRTLD